MIIKEIMTEKIAYVSVPGNRDKALELMISENVSGLPVVKEGTKTLIGIVTRSDLIQNPDEEQLALIMSRDLVTTTLNEDIKDVAKKMLKADVRRVPVLENDELIGIVTASDFVSEAIADMEIKEPVESYMIRTIPTTWEKTPLNVAFEIMKFFNLKCVVSLNDQGQLSGIITETDFIKESEVISETSVHSSTVGTEGDKWSWDSTNVLYVEKNHLKFSDKLVKDVSALKVATVNTKTKVSECAKKMKTHNIEQIPVTGIEGELVGLIRANDLLKALID
ncbi:MAG: CBS domain-containing protein [Methanobrevibacter sp.]|jgi:CBS domain-containing protein|nr:CBS domain-containing protein [Methanobrevibacter sp.]